MECPACREPLIVLDHDNIEVDYCQACRGVWLDAHELDLLLGDVAQRRAFLAMGSPALAKEAPRCCPECARKMAKVTAGPVVYDRCDRGHGVWFDEGELGRLLAEGHTETRVPEFLVQIFGQNPAG